MAIPSLCFRSNTMTCPKCVIFQSDQTMIQRNGDNCGYIYNPTGLIYTGKTFNILPGEPILLIPHQPDNCGPWKQSRTAFENGRFLKCKEEETLAILIENRFPNEVFKVNNGWSLTKILDHWGIQHVMTFVSDHHLQKIETYELITLDDSDDEDDKSFVKSKKVKKCCCTH